VGTFCFSSSNPFSTTLIRVAAELNRQIVQRNDWVSTALQDNDRLEIVRFVGAIGDRELQRTG